MRYRVRFRYREDTGEVEIFRVDAVGNVVRIDDHDLAHDRITADVARIVEVDAHIDELPGAAPPPRVSELREEPGSSGGQVWTAGA